MVSISFTLYYEDPYWTGLIEESSGGHIRIGRIVFGAEPSNPEIIEFVREKLSSIRLHEINDLDMLANARRVPKPDKWRSGTKRSLSIYKAVLCDEKATRKAADRRTIEIYKEEEFQRKQMKKKQKKQGH